MEKKGGEPGHLFQPDTSGLSYRAGLQWRLPARVGGQPSIVAWRPGNAPAILRVYKVGTATIMASHAINPIYRVFSAAALIMTNPPLYWWCWAYYSDGKTGHLLSQSFNSSTPVLYYTTKTPLNELGLTLADATNLAATGEDAVKLREASLAYNYANGGYQGWIQIENFSAGHGLSIATQENGLVGADARLLFNDPLQVKYIQRRVNMS